MPTHKFAFKGMKDLKAVHPSSRRTSGNSPKRKTKQKMQQMWRKRAKICKPLHNKRHLSTARFCESATQLGFPQNKPLCELMRAKTKFCVLSVSDRIVLKLRLHGL